MKIVKLNQICAILLVFLVLTKLNGEPLWVKNVFNSKININSDEKKSSFIILYDQANMEFSKNNKAKISIKRAVLIQKLAGEEKGILTEYECLDRKIKNLKGWIQLPSGKVEKLDKKLIISIGTSPMSGYYDDGSIKFASFKNLEPGSIVAFEYTIEEKGWTSYFQNFVFQRQEPVKFTKLTVKIPEGWELYKSSRFIDSLEFGKQNNTYIWIGGDLPYRPEENMMPPWDYLKREIKFTCTSNNIKDKNSKSIHFNNWEDVNKWIKNIFSTSFVQNEKIKNKVINLTKNETDNLGKIKRITNFVQKKIRYVAIEIGKNRWIPRTASETYQNGYGDCKDKSILTVSMLQQAGIKAYPVLVNTDQYVDPELPTSFQFNHVVVAIPIDSQEVGKEFTNAVFNDLLFFDPTDFRFPLGDLPPVLQGNNVLVVSEKDTALFELPFNKPENNKRKFRAKAKINIDGSLNANVKIIDYKGKAYIYNYFRKNKTQDELISKWNNYFSESIPHSELKNLKIGADSDSSWIEFDIHAKNYASKTANYFIFQPNFFQSKIPIMSGKKREYPIWFGNAKIINTEIFWDLPAAWHFTDPPHIIEKLENVGEFSMKSKWEKEMYHYNFDYLLLGELVEKELYLKAKKYNKMYNKVVDTKILIEIKN